MPRMNRCSILVAALLCTAAAGAQEVPASGILLDSYAAVVNGKVVTVGDVLAAMQPAQERLLTEYTGRDLEQHMLAQFNSTRSNLIESELVLMDFETQGGTLPDRAVEDHVNSVIHDQFNNDRTAFLKALADQRLTYSEWHKQIKDQLVVQIMRQREVVAKILITPLDLQQAYNERKLTDFSLPERVRLRSLAFSGKTVDESRAAADALRTHILNGDVAFTNAAAAGITLQDDGEWLDNSSLNEQLRAAIAALAPGDISAPLEIGGEIYLVQLAERQEARTRSFDEVAPELEKQLRAAQFDRLNQAWIDSLRAKYYVQLFDHDLFD